MFVTRSVRQRRRVCLQVETLEGRLVPTLLGNSLFPADNPWNEKITNAPVAANSSTLVASIGLSGHLHPDFGAALYQGANVGIPFNVVPGTQPKITVVIDAYASESDIQPVPIPANAVIEGDPLPSAQNTGDRHLLVYDQDNNVGYELYNAHRPSETADGQWHADAEAVWDYKKDSFRPAGWTSADAAGLPILPGLVRPDEVLDQGVITHALRFTVPHSQNAYVYPASHQAGVANTSYPRMGERFRLKQSFDISGFSPANRVILQALKDYGMIVADNGSGWFLSGEPSSRWNDDDLHLLTNVLGSNFEAVDLTPVVTGISPTTGPTTGGTSVTITGLNFSGGAAMTQVFFGSTAAPGVSVNSDTSITVTAPAQAAGTVHVTVRSPYGTSVAVSADQFTYTSSTPQPGQLQFGAATYSVAENGGSVTLTVTRTGGSSGAVSVAYATANGTATAGADYTATSGTLNFADGQTSQTITVPVIDDTLVEGNETFSVALSSPGGGATLGSPAAATVTIVDNDVAGPGKLQFSSATYSVSEGAGTAVITVQRVGGSQGSVTVRYATSNGTATAGSDYAAASGKLTFANGETSKTFTIRIIDDTLVEGNETVKLRLSSATGGATLGTPSAATLTILDNDGGGSSGPLVAGSPSAPGRSAWGWQDLVAEVIALQGDKPRWR
jgi:hypothetical protein